jgi:hypothetical protein
MRTTLSILPLLLVALSACAMSDLPDDELLDVDDISETSAAVTSSQPAWIGNYETKLTRESGHACAGGSPAASPVLFGTWARDRAVITNFCFQVWEPGVTDWNNPNLWQQLDTRVYYRWGTSGTYSFQYVNFSDYTGNNARYAKNLRDFDPYKNVSCSGPVSKTLQMYFWVNGKKSPTYSVRYEACT